MMDSLKAMRERQKTRRLYHKADPEGFLMTRYTNMETDLTKALNLLDENEKRWARVEGICFFRDGTPDEVTEHFEEIAKANLWRQSELEKERDKALARVASLKEALDWIWEANPEVAEIAQESRENEVVDD